MCRIRLAGRGEAAILAQGDEPRNIAPMSDIRNYAVAARSTDTFGRVLCSARTHHFIIDGPVQNGCPGEEVTPPETFLAGVAACAVELIQVIGKQQGHENIHVTADLRAELDRANPVRSDYTVFNSVEMDLAIEGVSAEIAFELAEQFKKR
ncbi:MAG TPA: hypothetical protein VM100_03250 [Longimicrobiales bacterium]|nr:hypothetical protein [Longimicrobiales bacterium]